ncbi:MAG: hypothetical protein DMG83_09050 [Acidobacteria bacterium]|nr:MAG: hypothetical protein DMG83_09050 [Acidobacteriota bacterium]
MLHQIACGSRISQVRVLVNANAGAGFVLVGSLPSTRRRKNNLVGIIGDVCDERRFAAASKLTR